MPQYSLSPHWLILHRWRRFRRVAVEGLSKSVVQKFYPIQGREAIMLALALMKSPSALEKHFQRHAWSIMLSINYHFPPVNSEDDPVVVGVAKHVERLLHEMQPGARLVEFFTWMRYIPSRCAHCFFAIMWSFLLRSTKICQVETGCRVLVRPRFAPIRGLSRQSRK